jgi:hypothetical protein
MRALGHEGSPRKVSSSPTPTALTPVPATAGSSNSPMIACSASSTQAWEARAPDLPLADAEEALIMASIVEKETGREDERAKVAAVFVNRLRRGMRLQSDPTVIYGLGARYDGDIHTRDLETDTPYNTYTRAGLPPTPIALPGAASLQATLHPADTMRCTSLPPATAMAHTSSRPHWRSMMWRYAPTCTSSACRYVRSGTGRRRDAPRADSSASRASRARANRRWHAPWKAALRERGLPVLLTREPGGSPLAEQLRTLVLERGPERITPTAETLLMFAARSIHIENRIRPALRAGQLGHLRSLQRCHARLSRRRARCRFGVDRATGAGRARAALAAAHTGARSAGRAGARSARARAAAAVIASRTRTALLRARARALPATGGRRTAARAPDRCDPGTAARGRERAGGAGRSVVAPGRLTLGCRHRRALAGAADRAAAPRPAGLALPIRPADPRSAWRRGSCGWRAMPRNWHCVARAATLRPMP